MSGLGIFTANHCNHNSKGLQCIGTLAQGTAFPGTCRPRDHQHTLLGSRRFLYSFSSMEYVVNTTSACSNSARSVDLLDPWYTRTFRAPGAVYRASSCRHWITATRGQTTSVAPQQLGSGISSRTLACGDEALVVLPIKRLEQPEE